MRFTLQELEPIATRAMRAASNKAASFAIPELASIADIIAEDPRAGSIGIRATHWAASGALYHDLVRMTAAYVSELEAIRLTREDVYVPKARDDVEPLLALWPDVLALPTTEQFSGRDLIALRALPVHPLGVVSKDSWADGRVCSPAEYFFHDLDHARFKIREDLMGLCIPIGDAYVDGTTFDSEQGKHRVILPEALGKVGSSLWATQEAKSALAERLFAAIDAESDRKFAETADLLLFEILHEKSFPLDAKILRRELSSQSHTTKLRQKCELGFFGPLAPSSGTSELLEEARTWLLERIP